MVAFDTIFFFKLVGNENMQNMLDECEFEPDSTTDYGISCHLAPNIELSASERMTIPIRLIMGKMVSSLFFVCF